MARIVLRSMGISYCLPVRLSTIVSVCRAWAMRLSAMLLHHTTRAARKWRVCIMSSLAGRGQAGGGLSLARLYLFFATTLTLPGSYIKLSAVHTSHGIEAFAFGMGILGAAFLLSWAAEVAQIDISKWLAVAILALITVLPEY